MDGRDGAPRQYRGMLDCFRQVARKEGLAGLYKARARRPRPPRPVARPGAPAPARRALGCVCMRGAAAGAVAGAPCRAGAGRAPARRLTGARRRAGRGHDHRQDRAGGRHLLGRVRRDAHLAALRGPAVRGLARGVAMRPARAPGQPAPAREGDACERSRPDRRGGRRRRPRDAPARSRRGAALMRARGGRLRMRRARARCPRTRKSQAEPIGRALIWHAAGLLGLMPKYEHVGAGCCLGRTLRRPGVRLGRPRRTVWPRPARRSDARPPPLPSPKRALREMAQLSSGAVRAVPGRA